MIVVQPTKTRYLRVTHPTWKCAWDYQFPESIPSPTGWVMDYHGVEPQWRSAGANAWEYEWETDDAYLDLQERMGRQDPNQAAKVFRKGIRVRASIAAESDALRMEIALTNHSDVPFLRVACDGGCFQAKSADFAGDDEVGRTFLLVGARMTSLGRLQRTVPVRCTYHRDPADYDRPPGNDGEWFWGRSTASCDHPAVIGMVSHDGARCVVMGYEGANSASANADDHHCIHSRPSFGDIAPGATVTRRGLILFGEDIHRSAALLLQRLDHSVPPFASQAENARATGL
jgi:hypothetical protein